MQHHLPQHILKKKYKRTMTGYITDAYTAIFSGLTHCGKSHLVIALIEKEYNKHFGYMIIICTILQWNKTYHAKDWIKNDDKV